MGDFKPPGFYDTLYRKPVQNKDAYGNDVNIYRDETPNKIDIVNDNLIYMGWSEFGADINSNKWKIKKAEQIGTVWNFMYADGDMKYDNVWNNRTILMYK